MRSEVMRLTGRSRTNNVKYCLGKLTLSRQNTSIPVKHIEKKNILLNYAMSRVMELINWGFEPDFLCLESKLLPLDYREIPLSLEVDSFIPTDLSRRLNFF